MTTLSLNVTLDDQEARAFEELSQALGDDLDQLAAEAIRQMIHRATNAYIVQTDVETYSHWQERLQPYRETGSFKNEDEFLNR